MSSPLTYTIKMSRRSGDGSASVEYIDTALPAIKLSSDLNGEKCLIQSISISRFEPETIC